MGQKNISITLFAFSVCIGCGLCGQQKVQTMRTALHIARSLNPDSMESLSVKTKDGSHATIIVKKRSGKSDVNTSDSVPLNGTLPMNYTLISKSESKTNFTGMNRFLKELSTGDESSSVITALNRTDQNTHVHLPDPVFINSSMVYVKHDINPTKKGKSLVKVDMDGIPVITGVRVPDDDTDQQIWRNARVINGILVPYDKGDKESVTKYKPSHKPTTARPFGDSKDNWLEINSINKKPTKTTMEPASMKTDVWNENKWYMYRKPSGASKPQIIEQVPILQTVDPGDDVERTRPVLNQYTQHPTGIWMASDTDENPDHKYVTDRILQYIRNINKEEMKRLSVQKFTARDARMLPSSNEQPQIQPRILQMPGASVFASTAMYSSSTQSPSRVSFEEGVRTPVLQYAHPEYGVQSAKSEPSTSEIIDKKDTFLYNEDMHADRGPFVSEPATLNIDNKQDTDNLSSKRSHIMSPYHQRPKKTLLYFNPPEKHSFLPPYDHKPYVKHPLKDGYKISEYPPSDWDGKPFWIKLGDSLKVSVQSGIDKMTDLTRPVVEPLVEATQKISHNLGLTSGNRELSTIRDKIGSVSGSSLILPAIGIVAGGAALGLGAVAVGRYLNYDVVKMRKAKSMDGDNLLIDHTTTGNLEALWAEDNGRSEFSTEIATSAIQSSALDSTIANTTTHSTTPIPFPKKNSDENPKKSRRKRATKNYNVKKHPGSIFKNVEIVTSSSQKLPNNNPMHRIDTEQIHSVERK